MRLSEWNRHFKKTDPSSIHREKIKLIARHHASIWRSSVRRVRSVGWKRKEKKNSSSEMLMTTTVAPSSLFFFFFSLSFVQPLYQIVSSVWPCSRNVLDDFPISRAEEIKSARDYRVCRALARVLHSSELRWKGECYFLGRGEREISMLHLLYRIYISFWLVLSIFNHFLFNFFFLFY